jgi:hypothetical protein
MGVSPFFGVCFIADKTLGYTRFAFYTRIPTPPLIEVPHVQFDSERREELKFMPAISY